MQYDWDCKLNISFFNQSNEKRKEQGLFKPNNKFAMILLERTILACIFFK